MIKLKRKTKKDNALQFTIAGRKFWAPTVASGNLFLKRKVNRRKYIKIIIMTLFIRE